MERNLPKGQPADEPIPLVYAELRRLAGAGTSWHDTRHFVGIALAALVLETATTRAAFGAG